MRETLFQILKLVSAILLICGSISVGVVTINYSLTSPYGSTWVEVPAEITYTYSVRAYGSKQGSGLVYMPKPVYSFIAYDGREYKGSTYSIPFGTTGSLDFLEGSLETPIVVEGSVFYNPENPNQSAVERPSFHPITVAAVLLFAFMALLSGCVLLMNQWFDRGVWYMWHFFKKKS